VSGRPHGGPDEIRRDMVRQVTSPVRWLDTIRWFKSQGVTDYLECGPGRVLSGLIRRIDGDAGLHTVQDTGTLKQAVGDYAGTA
jgi:[acyl-carrier-protein] S-malonyltransferase